MLNATQKYFFAVRVRQYEYLRICDLLKFRIYWMLKRAMTISPRLQATMCVQVCCDLCGIQGPPIPCWAYFHILECVLS